MNGKASRLELGSQQQKFFKNEGGFAEHSHGAEKDNLLNSRWRLKQAFMVFVHPDVSSN